VDRNELLAMLNRDDLWKSGRAIAVVARKLGIPESSLKNKMNRWGVIRGPYVIDE